MTTSYKFSTLYTRRLVALDDMTNDQQSLVSMMSELSERYYSAGWMSGLEESLWEVLQGNPHAFAGGSISAEETEALRAACEKADGWVIWKDDSSYLGEVFVPMDLWLVLWVLSR